MLVAADRLHALGLEMGDRFQQEIASISQQQVSGFNGKVEGDRHVILAVGINGELDESSGTKVVDTLGCEHCRGWCARS